MTTQLAAVKKIEAEEAECRLKGDWVYEHYQQLDTALKAIHKMRKEGKPWAEINKMLGSKVRVDEKKGLLIIDG